MLSLCGWLHTIAFKPGLAAKRLFQPATLRICNVQLLCVCDDSNCINASEFGFCNQALSLSCLGRSVAPRARIARSVPQLTTLSNRNAQPTKEAAHDCLYVLFAMCNRRVSTAIASMTQLAPSGTYFL